MCCLPVMKLSFTCTVSETIEAKLPVVAENWHCNKVLLLSILCFVYESDFSTGVQVHQSMHRSKFWRSKEKVKTWEDIVQWTNDSIGWLQCSFYCWFEQVYSWMCRTKNGVYFASFLFLPYIWPRLFKDDRIQRVLWKIV